MIWQHLKRFWLRKDDSAVKEREEKIDRRRDWKTIFRSGHGLTLQPQLGQLSTGLDEKNGLLSCVVPQRPCKVTR